MKIGVIRQRYVAVGGAERYLDGVIRELIARGHEVHLFANAWRAGGGNFTFHRVPMIKMTSFLKALSFALASRRVVEGAQCDLVFSLERTLQQDVYRAGDGCHREWLRRRAEFASPLKRATTPLNPFHRTMLAIERRTFSPQRTGQIIANSHRGKKEIIAHYGFPENRIHVIHNGVDCDRFHPAAETRQGSELILLFVGTGFERKGLRFCIEALAQLPSHVRLRVAGRGNVRPYQALARKCGVHPRVEFLAEPPDIAAVYRQADLLVHPAIYEPFANVCLEAMASGLPVITSRINGASEVIEHGKSGAIVDGPDGAKLAEAISRFLDPEVRRAAARRARAAAEACPLGNNVAATLRVFEVALREKSIFARHVTPSAT